MSAWASSRRLGLVCRWMRAGWLVEVGFCFTIRCSSCTWGDAAIAANDAITLTAFGLIATRMPDGSPGVFAAGVHHRGGLSADTAGDGFYAAGYRRHGGDQSDLRSGGSAARAEERHAGDALISARRGGQCAGDHPSPWHGVPGAQRQLPARHSGQDWLVHADLGAAGAGADSGVRGAEAAAGAGPHQRAAAVARQRSDPAHPGCDRG